MLSEELHYIILEFTLPEYHITLMIVNKAWARFIYKQLTSNTQRKTPVNWIRDKNYLTIMLHKYRM